MPWKNLYLNDPKHWRMRAREARIYVEKITNPEARLMMLEIVDTYEKLAKRAEQGLVWEEGPRLRRAT